MLEICEEDGELDRSAVQLLMTKGMVQTIVVCLLCLVNRRVQAGPIRSYLSALKQAHLMRGSDSRNFGEEFILSMKKGQKNKDALQPEKERTVIAQTMRTLREALNISLRGNMKTRGRLLVVLWIIKTLLVIGTRQKEV